MPESFIMNNVTRCPLWLYRYLAVALVRRYTLCLKNAPTLKR